jgi:hypothetical protein
MLSYKRCKLILSTYAHLAGKVLLYVVSFVCLIVLLLATCNLKCPFSNFIHWTLAHLPFSLFLLAFSLVLIIYDYYVLIHDNDVVCFRYYKRAYQELFLSNDGKPADNSSETSAQQASEHYRFGWLLFLSLRIQTNSRAKNLLTSTTELVSVLVRTPTMIELHMCHLIFSSHATRQSCIILVNL